MKTLKSIYGFYFFLVYIFHKKYIRAYTDLSDAQTAIHVSLWQMMNIITILNAVKRPGADKGGYEILYFFILSIYFGNFYWFSGKQVKEIEKKYSKLDATQLTLGKWLVIIYMLLTPILLYLI